MVAAPVEGGAFEREVGDDGEEICDNDDAAESWSEREGKCMNAIVSKVWLKDTMTGSTMIKPEPIIDFPPESERVA